MSDPAAQVSRAGELGLEPDELRAAQAELSSGLVASLLGALIRYEDALAELAAAPASSDGSTLR